MTDTIIRERRGAWHRLTLNRPDRMNALNRPMHDAILRALDEAAHDADCRALLIAGEGRGFCAGQDLAALADTDVRGTLERYYNPLVRSCARCRSRWSARCNGVAAGAGANLALACDIVLAARSARFMQAFVRRSAWCRMPAALGSCRGWSATARARAHGDARRAGRAPSRPRHGA